MRLFLLDCRELAPAEKGMLKESFNPFFSSIEPLHARLSMNSQGNEFDYYFCRQFTVDIAKEAISTGTTVITIEKGEGVFFVV